MEKLDIVTLNVELTGTCADRRVVHAQGLWHRTVHVWVRNRGGALLLQKRSDEKETHPGLWDISCAGHLSAGDSSVQGAVRELQEELGLLVDPHRLTYLFTLKEQWKSPDGAINDNEIKDVFLCESAVERGEITFDTVEVSDVRFCTVEQFRSELSTHPNLFVPHDEEYQRLFEYLTQEQR